PVKVVVNATAVDPEITGARYYVKPASEGGKNSNTGLSDATAWATISEVNSRNFNPGDGILFKAGGVWREELVISHSGEEGKPIVFTRYGSGPNPVIRASNQAKANELTKESANIYSFSTKSVDPTWLTAWGIEDSKGNLMSRHWSSYRESKYTAPSNSRNPVISELEANMIDGFSWMPTNLGKVFVRSNSGNPGDIEIGKRKNCVYIRNKHDIVFDSIDFYGPTGGDNLNALYTALIMTVNSDRIVVENSVLKNSPRAAIQFRDGSSYCMAKNNIFESVGSGVSACGPSNYAVVSKNRFKDIGAQIASVGDRTVIGTNGHHWLIEDNYIENHGWEGQADSESVEACKLDPSKCPHMDRAISACCGLTYGDAESGNHIVRRNYLKNLGSGAIRFWGGSRNQIYDNIFDGFFLYPPFHGSKMSGVIEIATWDNDPHLPTPVLYDNKIFNNVFTGGVDTQSMDSIIYFSGAQQGLEIKNNIIYDNDENFILFDYHYLSYDYNTNFEIDNNMFEIKNPAKRGVYWHGTFYTYDRLISPTGCPNPGYWQCDKADTSRGIVKNNFFGNPLFVNPSVGDFHLQPTSPAIDKGIDLGSPYNLGLNPASVWPNSVSTLNQNNFGSGWEMGAFVFGE
ncbi:right-handed parallel beta-helix repeat-containing protein, partial [Candidatus Parcubacteria bacterium]|nr:right-handed parallel beta-helix repeat-containing protein [Candidatus Parcubacteria bacterium]